MGGGRTRTKHSRARAGICSVAGSRGGFARGWSFGRARDHMLQYSTLNPSASLPLAPSKSKPSRRACNSPARSQEG